MIEYPSVSRIQVTRLKKQKIECVALKNRKTLLVPRIQGHVMGSQEVKKNGELLSICTSGKAEIKVVSF